MNINIFRLINRIILSTTYKRCLVTRRTFHKYSFPTMSHSYCFAARASYFPNLQLLRYKYKKQKSQTVEEESDSDEEEDDGIPDKHAKTVNVYVTSLRTDLIVKSGLSLARNKVEKLFYESRIRLNGQKVLKKSAHVNIGDEIDVVRGPSPSNPKFLLVARIQVLSAKGVEERIVVKLRRFKSLIIENYKEPWEQQTEENQ